MRDLSFSGGGDGHKHYIHMCQDLGGFGYSCSWSDTMNPWYDDDTRVLEIPSKLLVMLQCPINGWY